MTYQVVESVRYGFSEKLDYSLVKETETFKEAEAAIIERVEELKKSPDFRWTHTKPYNDLVHEVYMIHDGIEEKHEIDIRISKEGS